LLSALQLLLQHSASSPQATVSGLQVPATPWNAQYPAWVHTWLQHWGPLMQETLVSRQA
jgi:predicted ATP-dependent endonuclease of OLD family